MVFHFLPECVGDPAVPLCPCLYSCLIGTREREEDRERVEDPAAT